MRGQGADEADMSHKGHRLFRVELRMVFLGGTFDEDGRQAWERAFLKAGPASVRDRRMTVTADPYNVVEVTAEVRARNAVEAGDVANRVVDDALLGTGLFDQFDVSGKSLAVRPAEWSRPAHVHDRRPG